ncbi:hypothetical protein WA158_002785 [Blastocystis sp. Blastoise]
MAPKKQGMRTGNSSDNPDRVAKKRGLRDRSKIKLLNTYRMGKVKYDRDGKAVGGFLRSDDKSGGQLITGQARIEPNRKWFGNTRTIAADQLDKFREEVAKTSSDPYSFLLKTKTLPMSLIQDPTTVNRMNLLSAESFQHTFGPGKQRKRPKLSTTDINTLVTDVQSRGNNFDVKVDKIPKGEAMRDAVKDIYLNAGQSKRIWNELYKVLDCSDVVIQVLDARDPMGTRCYHVEQHLQKFAKHKHMIFVLNKCDLVPTWVTKKWVAILSQEYPTLAFHASVQHSYGKGALFDLLRQFALLHKEKKQISVGFIGYPNVGKSSIINTLKQKDVCKVAPIPGETKIWQYITLMKNIFLIDCPGVVYQSTDSDSDIVLKGVVRAERLEEPDLIIPAILDRVKKEYLQKTYNIEDWKDPEDFLAKFAFKNGKMLKGGEPDKRQASVMIINDLQRGKLPYFIPPPLSENEKVKEDETAPLVEDNSKINVDQSELLDDVNEIDDEALLELPDEPMDN